MPSYYLVCFSTKIIKAVFISVNTKMYVNNVITSHAENDVQCVVEIAENKTTYYSVILFFPEGVSNSPNDLFEITLTFDGFLNFVQRGARKQAQLRISCLLLS